MRTHKDAETPQECQWFPACGMEATHTQSHPVLGEVPICDRCQHWYDEQVRQVRKVTE